MDKEEILKLWKNVFWSISHPTRLAILTLLYGYDEKSLPPNSLYFSDLKKGLKIEKSELVYHLKLLQKAGLITNMYPPGERRKNRYSVYRLTSKGINILESLKIPKMLERYARAH